VLGEQVQGRRIKTGGGRCKGEEVRVVPGGKAAHGRALKAADAAVRTPSSRAEVLFRLEARPDNSASSTVDTARRKERVGEKPPFRPSSYQYLGWKSRV